MPFTFANPLWLIALLLLIPLLFLSRRPGSTSSVTYSTLSILIGLGEKPKRFPGSISFALMLLSLACAVIALARPQWKQEFSDRKASGVDIVLAIDISYSMEIIDFRLNRRSVQRIDAAKATAEQFIRQRPNDRIGIIAFSGRPYVTSPITLEHDWLIGQLRELQPGLVKEQGTAVGSAIAAASTRLQERPSKSKVVVLVTDGSNNSGQLAPLEAAKHAATLGVKIYTIAIGTEEGRLYNGRQAYPQQEFDTKTLEEIAKITKAEYYRVRDTDKLRETFKSIDQLEKTDIKQHSMVTTTELFPLWTAAALLLALSSLTIQSLTPPPAP
ncbi:VWA domain-containing protein [Verrucomicrobiaceae bacterium N1E253]|uniref:VWA domain-containing protein n=1 Tax=Oceaniferula marina TaxID=2748318 RepID=A0A851GIJ4_9BACT|nr:VWA domain-containing protein [Oceaniferula marina]NWK57618.1 VWA domain-containing protein [Oceaniferula marina]